MPSQSTRSAQALSTVALAFSRDEWELLTTLPRRVLIAATSAEADPECRTVAEGIAGMEAIAAGRASPSPLVREVVAAIYAERGADEPAAEEYTDRRAGIHSTLWAGQRASHLLASKATAPNAAAYREWLTAIAWAVCEAVRGGGPAGPGGVLVSAAETRFLDELQAVLGT